MSKIALSSKGHEREQQPAPAAQAAPAPAYQIAIKPVSFFRQSEETDLTNVHKLVTAMLDTATWTTPIPVTKDHGIVMDGNHRLRAAKLLGLRYVPCIPLDYQDPRVSVLHWTTNEPFCIDTIYRTIMSNGVFQYKTTKHSFSPALPTTDIPLRLLATG
ncbi:MAG TPA: ParB N-terminal domain-containing protein [Paucimonas sp.]|nr:ParB N-terminal domain-containing protein [Paucimonas sp.]